MEQSRLKLDNQVFNGRLRQRPSVSGYISRPTPRPAARIHDIYQPVKQAKQPTIAKLQSQAPKQDQKANSHFKPKAPRLSKRPPLLYVMAGLLFVIGLTVSLQGFRTNHLAQAQVNKLASHTTSSSTNSSADPPPAITKPSALAISSYQVAPDLPRYIDIPSISVHARVFAAGTTKSGALATPSNVYDTAWYNASAKPGQPGAMLIDGHISSWTTHGVFYSLNKLTAGNSIVITRGDGTTFTYTVVKTQLYDADKVDMASMLVSADPAKPGLNLISCSGDVIPGTSDFNKRLAVYAVEN